MKHQIKDDFFWLRDPKWPQIENKEILEYLQAENSYAALFFDNYKTTIAKIYEELKARVKLTDQSPYIKKKDYFYYTRTEAEKSYPIFCRKRYSIESNEEILLDVNGLLQDGSFISIGDFSVSPDNTKVAYSIDYNGDERYEIRILDFVTNAYLDDKITNSVGKIVWHEKQQGFFYTKSNEYLRSDKVFFHKLGSLLKEDQLILQEKDPLYNLTIKKSSDLKYLFIEISGHDNNECRFINMQDNAFLLEIVQSRSPKLLYEVDHYCGEFFILTNDSTDDFRLAVTKVSTPSKGYWQTFIETKKEEYFKSFYLSKSYLILNYQVNGLAKIKILDLQNKVIRTLDFDEVAFEALAYTSNFEEDDIRVEYSSLKQPCIVYQYNFILNKLTTLKIDEIPSGFCPDDYQVERLYSNNNGTLIPISLVYKKSEFKVNGSNPLFLYGYGSYGVSISPAFNSNIFSLIDRGFIYAIAHVRGGDDLGYNWYKEAKFLNKKNTFEDFICCSKFLIENNYTKKGNIVVSGGSAGGLLIGVIINSNPELYKAAVLYVPFVDVLNTMLDESLPLTPGEFAEWGNPKEPEYFDYIKSYSPYDNITPQAYPHIYVNTGLSDSRVGYWEPAKWVAKLRSLKTDNNKLIFKIDMKSGHKGPSGRFAILKEKAQDYTFILSSFNLI